jgi:von Willebrand factor type A domain-containing protein/vault protein inter-alpha-trypsin-like protein
VDGWQHVVRVAAPDLAFITRFALEERGLTYEARIEAAEDAHGQYNATVAAAQAAALIESPQTDVLEVLLNIPAQSTITVHLSYEQLVHKSLGEYTYRFPLVALAGARTIGVLTIDGTLTGAAAVDNVSLSLGTYSHPAPSDLTFTHSASHLVPSQDLVLRWTEPAPRGAGSFLVHAGTSAVTFVHVFSPDAAGPAFTPLSKDIVFVIDVSGSMSSSMGQVKAAFSSIIRDLRPDDRFDVVAFDDSTYVWAGALQGATPSNIEAGVAWVNSLRAAGGTDIDAGLTAGISKLVSDPSRAPALVLLSDGDATVGVDSDTTIRYNLQARNTVGASVYTLAFGGYANFELMRALAFENDGEIRSIFPGDDASAQIQGFYETIATPLLRSVYVEYTEGVADAAPTYFARAYAGSELTVVGRLLPGVTNVTVHIAGRSSDGDFALESTFEVAASQAGAFVERSWAYEHVRSLMRAAAVGDAAARAEAVSLALAHRFVTEYTSLIVVLPPALQAAPGVSRGDLRVTTSSVSPSTLLSPPGAYHGAPPPRTAPGADTTFAACALAAGGIAALIRRRSRRSN